MSETKKYFSNFFLDFENLDSILKIFQKTRTLLPDVFFELTDSEKRDYINV